MKAVIFDLDGVLVDTARYHFLAWKRLAAEFDYDFTEDDNERFKGVSRMTCMEILCELCNVEMTEEEMVRYATRKNEWYVESIADMDESELLDGAKELLITLREKDIKVALGSASKNAPMILEKTGITPLFDAVIDGNHVSKAKPDPEVFLKGAASLKVDVEDCVVFEDAFAGVEAAKNANMKAIGVGCPSVLTNADCVISSLTEFSL